MAPRNPNSCGRSGGETGRGRTAPLLAVAAIATILVAIVTIAQALGHFSSSSVSATPTPPSSSATPSPEPTPTFVPGSLGDCWFDNPPDGIRVRYYVLAKFACLPKTSISNVYVIVHPPTFPNQPTLRSAVYPIYPKADGAYFAELIVGTASKTDDGWAYTACLTRLSDKGAAVVQSYLSSPDRSGLPEAAEELERMQCVRIVHDPNVVPATDEPVVTPLPEFK